MALALPPQTFADQAQGLLRSGITPEQIDRHLSELARDEEAAGNAEMAIYLRKKCERLIGFTEYGARGM